MLDGSATSRSGSEQGLRPALAAETPQRPCAIDISRPRLLNLRRQARHQAHSSASRVLTSALQSDMNTHWNQGLPCPCVYDELESPMLDSRTTVICSTTSLASSSTPTLTQLTARARHHRLYLKPHADDTCYALEDSVSIHFRNRHYSCCARWTTSITRCTRCA